MIKKTIPVLFVLVVLLASMKLVSSPVKGKHFDIPADSSVLKIPMIFVEGGSFQMGSDRSTYSMPVHSVTLNSYYIGKYEVTQAEWNAVMGQGANPSRHKNCEKCPVENMNWDDITLFIQKLNQLTGRKYRLPTEAEWEFAARGGNKSKGYIYSGSNDFHEVEVVQPIHVLASTYPVGGKKANELGIYDMTGNVHEFCQDWYLPGYYQQSPYENPQGPDFTDQLATMHEHSIRGGGLSLVSQVTDRMTMGVQLNQEQIPNNGIIGPGNGVGFRLVLDM